jgi:DNA-binding beta-propeller fold protein YncE
MGRWHGPDRFVNRVARRKVIGLALATSALLVVAATALAATGDLTQPAGTAGCISQTGAGPCADGHGLLGPASVAVSPDGKSVYVASSEFCCTSPPDDSAVVRFNRNPPTGAISQPAGAAGCISDSGAGPCADGRALAGARAVAVSPDGKSVYVASFNSGAVARLNRNTTTGAISQPAGEAGCISVPDVSPGAEPCADGHALGAPTGVAVSPDGKSVYVTDFAGNGVARLNRNTTTGAIGQPAGRAGCVSDNGTDNLGGTCADGHGLRQPFGLTVSPDGKSVYVASFFSGAVARLNRNTTTGAIRQPAGTAGCVSEDGAGPCANGHALAGAWSVAVSPDGKTLYAASLDADAVTRFDRNTTTGAIVQPEGLPGCISDSGAGMCKDGHGLDGTIAVSVSPDGKSLYVASQNSEAVANITRNTTTGAISQAAFTRGCISEDGSGGCADGHALRAPQGVAVSPDKRSVYVAAFSSRAVARFIRAP